MQVGSFEAKTHLSPLRAAVPRGERVTIPGRGKPVAVPVPPEEGRSADAAALVAGLGAGRARTGAGPESIAELRDEGRRQ